MLSLNLLDFIAKGVDTRLFIYFDKMYMPFNLLSFTDPHRICPRLFSNTKPKCAEGGDQRPI